MLGAVTAGLALSLAAASTAGAAPTAEPAASAGGDSVPVQLLSITDLHGYFGEYTTTGARAGEAAQQVGGGAY
jgi:5'-nucleotidase